MQKKVTRENESTQKFLSLRYSYFFDSVMENCVFIFEKVLLFTRN